MKSPRSITAATVLLGLMLLVASFVPLPYLTFAPGPVYNTLGKVEGTSLVTISGRQTYDVSGELDMTTVREFGGPEQGVYLADAIRAWLDPAVTVVPKEKVYPDDSVTDKQVELQQAEDFRLSQAEAVGAALNYLKIPVTEQILATTIVKGSPSDGVIRAGSQIISVDGALIRKPSDVVQAVRSKPIGSRLDFVIVKDGQQVTKTLTTAKNPNDPKLPFVGMMVGVNYKAPFDIKFELDNVGGPSAGTMFALSIIDRLTPGAMTGGKHIAGTGTIDGDGQVGPIGGIAQKMVGAKRAGATLFLAPAENCNEVVGNIPKGLTVARVATLTEAVDIVTAYGKGQKFFPACK